MKLNELIKVRTKSKKRIGRGIGSGRGKTAGRGTKGQKARGKIPASFAGGTLPFYKKLPLRRGKGNPTLKSKLKPVSLSLLKAFKPKTVIDLEKLFEQNLISKKDLKRGVKILSKGELKIPLTIKIPVSEKARERIEKAGGKVQ